MSSVNSYRGMRRWIWSTGILFVAMIATVRCAPEETISPVDPTAALAEMSNSKGWWHWKQTLSIDPDSATISEPGDTLRLVSILSTAWNRNEPTLVDADWFVLDPSVVEIDGAATSTRSVVLRGLQPGVARIVTIYDGLAALARVWVGEGDPGGEPVPVAAAVSDPQPVLLVEDTMTIRPHLLDEDGEVIPTQPTEWSADFDQAVVAVSADFLVTALEPTPPGSSTPVVYTHTETELATDVEIVILPESDPGEWPDNEPPGMTPILVVDGSSKDWPGFTQGEKWQDDNRVIVVSDPESKHGNAIEKRLFVGDESGWNGIIYDGNFPSEELYFRMVFRVSGNWQWHKAGGKYFYYGAAGRSRGVQPTQFILGWHGDGRPFWSAAGDGYFIPNNVAASTRDVYHTIEIHHVASTSGANGSLRMWVDGIEVETFNRLGDPTQNEIQLVNREWNATRNLVDKRLAGLQAFMFWGGQNDTKRVNDWARLSELYISGKN